jgi:hypothetical protein
MLNPEILATLERRHRTLEKTAEGNDEWRVQRHWQHCPMLPVFLDCPFIIALYGFL